MHRRLSRRRGWKAGRPHFRPHLQGIRRLRIRPRRLSRPKGRKASHCHHHPFHLMDDVALETVLRRLRVQMRVSSVLHPVDHLVHKTGYKRLDPSILHL